MNEIKTMHASTDCREENGITVGLIDGMIAIARVLKTRSFDDAAVKEAMDDFKQDEDVWFLLR